MSDPEKASIENSTLITDPESSNLPLVARLVEPDTLPEDLAWVWVLAADAVMLGAVVWLTNPIPEFRVMSTLLAGVAGFALSALAALVAVNCLYWRWTAALERHGLVLEGEDGE
ncbi:hypothetical protein GQS65_15735 [Halomarina oriensis]|uniref:Uncharacterized protein n=2 Tax=Halomarina oriensis TaxID=671145 RepID=A0A6B0GRB5_9EURY|nr:hypothetical protein [Halomarina oriensis]